MIFYSDLIQLSYKSNQELQISIVLMAFMLESRNLISTKDVESLHMEIP